MSFVTQGASNSCGAFCLCYLKWLEAGRLPNGEDPAQHGPTDYPEVMDVYRYVQFGDSIPPGVKPQDLPPDYCDPVRMYTLLKLTHPNTSFYIENGSSLAGVFAAMRGPKSRDKAFIDAMEAAGALYSNTPVPVPPPLPGGAAIAIFDVSDSAHVLLGQHYILFRYAGENLRRYNPWDGMEQPCAGYGNFTYTEFGQTVTLSFARAALLVQ